MKLKKGDQVVVLSGKDAGKKGKLLKVFPKTQKVLVEGINIKKKHQRPTQKFGGGIIEKQAPMPAAKVQLICPRCSKAARVSRNDGRRFCKKCKEGIDKE
ncbi:MAG: large subunit ribosomal protein L24 [Candidatus Saganbacteria bacterium]|uniref:Large ribosomal subunit protein uL24 n=1 Tax=Candidatus Saganbacteria bacterium TaxID=2575572 RepID=A0A833L153_UNCSA|nr:MAG: large subunit ribosomal protein L24 [Candidatus Saganbacteria bacterium]